jgi:SpoVK/Ycf46/Vps4 family AAA+-type ATPase
MRYPNQLAINAIVSVFLRQLEYYNGILFLTTNRVGDIDPAFKSRVHVTLEYKPLNRQTTLEIYRLHLRKVKEDFEGRTNVRAKVKERDILNWAEQHYKESQKKYRQWNGRYVLT